MPVALTDAEFNLRFARCVRQVSLQRSAADLAAVVRLHTCELLEGSDAELLYFDPDHAVLWRANGGPDVAERVGLLGQATQHRGSARPATTREAVVAATAPARKPGTAPLEWRP